MKAIIRQKKIDMFEVLKIDRSMIGRILCDTDKLSQVIVEEDNQIILREISKEKNEQYKSTTDIDIYLKEGDLLIKLESGYTKPTIPIVELTKQEEKAIELINGEC